jgi:ABC-2 type transport system permease protein
MTGSLRVLLVGGMISFRALFNWLSPWIYVPSLLIAPIVQILLFTYMGRSAGVESDAFDVIGNAVQYSAIPCLFAMANTVAGERWTQTLGIVLVTPVRRLPLFLGRSLPVLANGFVVSMFSLVVGSLLLSVAVVRYRTAWAMGNLLEYPGWLLCGFLVPLALFPTWVTWIAYALPPTWGMAAIRASAAGVSPWSDILACLGLGLAYGLVGALVSEGVLRSARRHATLALT